MDVYVFQAGLYCEQCGEEIRRRLRAEGEAPEDPDDEETYDSDQYPKGPYPDGGGEADVPQHCDSGDQCVGAIPGNGDVKVGAFLENDLTDDGIEFVKQVYRERHATGDHTTIVDLWAHHYDLDEGLHNTQVEAVIREYGPKVLGLARRLADLCREHGLEAADPWENNADDYSVILVVRRPGAPDERSMDVQLEIADSASYGDDTAGVTFSMHSCMNGGLIKGPQFQPYNYTDECWVDAFDEEAVAERWQLFEDADLEECVDIINSELPEEE